MAHISLARKFTIRVYKSREKHFPMLHYERISISQKFVYLNTVDIQQRVIHISASPFCWLPTWVRNIDVLSSDIYAFLNYNH
jgi:hypothetical protein